MLDFENMSPLVRKAYETAAAAHKGQKDRAGKDYILHPMTVASALGDYPDEYIAAALLHDVVEDTDITLGELERDFPPLVTEAVKLLTHDEQVPYMDYVRAIKDSGNDIALKVKLSDLAHNMDLSRQSVVTQKDLDRQKNKYQPARALLLAD